MKDLHCDMKRECQEPVSHIGGKGYIYCAGHAQARHGWERCRALRPFEVAILKDGKALPSYEPLSQSETERRLSHAT